MNTMTRIALGIVVLLAPLAVLSPTGAHAVQPACHTTVKHRLVTLDGVAGRQVWYTERCRGQGVTIWTIWTPLP